MSFVDVKNLRRVFDVSKPWLNRVIEGGHLEYLKAVDGVTFEARRSRSSASPARARPRSRAWSLVSCRRARAM
jgi:hypothetical protein